jgi:hypothetical protein
MCSGRSPLGVGRKQMRGRSLPVRWRKWASIARILRTCGLAFEVSRAQHRRTLLCVILNRRVTHQLVDVV